MLPHPLISFFFFFNDTATTEIYTLSLHDALPIFYRSYCGGWNAAAGLVAQLCSGNDADERSEEHTSELQSLRHLVCRLLLEKKKKEDELSNCYACLCRFGDSHVSDNNNAASIGSM